MKLSGLSPGGWELEVSAYPYYRAPLHRRITRWLHFSCTPKGRAFIRRVEAKQHARNLGVPDAP